MTKPIIFDGTEHREMTDAEHAQWQADAIEAAAQAVEQAKRAIQKQVVLDRLGITADEAALLLG